MSESEYVQVHNLNVHPDVGDEALNELYPSIVEDCTQPYTFEVQRILYRCLLPSRIPEGEHFNIIVRNLVGQLIDDTKAILKSFNWSPNSIYYFKVGKYKGLKTPIKTILKAAGFQNNEPVDTWLKASINTENENEFINVFSNSETKITVAIGSSQSAYLWNMIAVISSKIIPWLFEGKPILPEERVLLNAINKGSDEFIAAANAIFSETPIKDRIEAMKFKKAYAGVREKLIRNISSVIEQENHRFESIQQQLFNTIATIQENELQLQSLSNGEDNDGSELAKLFASLPTLAIRRWEGETLYYSAKGMFTPSDIDGTEKKINDGNALLYSYAPNSLSHEDAKMLLKAACVDLVIKTPVVSNFMLNIASSSFRIEQGADPAPEFADCIPNTHHNSYGCSGNNIGKAIEFMKKGDIPMAVRQMLGTVSLWNVNDSTVTGNYMCHYFWNSSVTPFLLPDGRKVNFIDAITWLKEGH